MILQGMWSGGAPLPHRFGSRNMAENCCATYPSFAN
jgi:hypothetical protein